MKALSTMALLAFLLTPRGGEGECIYFPDLGTGRLYIVDAMTTHVDSIPVGNHLTDGAVIRDNAYILDAGQEVTFPYSEGNLTVLDLRRRETIRTVPLG